MQINQERLVQEFLDLVQIDSFRGQEREIADALKARLEALGFQVTEDDAGAAIGGTAGNLIAKRTGDRMAPTILFCAHMDRVAPGMGIKPQIEEGIIKSDGTTILAADDVAGLAAILEGVRVVEEQQIPHGDLEVVFAIAEEGGLHGAKQLDPKSLNAELGYFLDTGGPVGTIINQAPSHQNISFTFHGRAAHAGIEPEKGLNALVVAAAALTGMQLGRIDHETTANIGMMEGGTATNVIPDSAVVKGEVRSLDPAKLQHQLRAMQECAEQAAASFQTTVDVSIEDCYPAYHLDETSPVVQLGTRAARSIGLEPMISSTGGGSDANIVNGYGIPSVVLGLNFHDVHSKKESIAIEDLVRSAAYVASIIENA